VKHCHDGLDLGPPEKDSALLFAAGATSVTASSPGQVSTVARVDGDLELERIVASLDGGHDLVLAEGFKRSGVPKVLVEGPEAITPPVDGVIAVVGEGSGPGADIPRFGFDDMNALVGLIEERIPTGNDGPDVSLVVDGAPVGLAPFATTAFDGVVRGLLASLKGVPAVPRHIRLVIGKASANDGLGGGG
jgi:molybdopterin-guanine dinucleotide biosynthesis protein MobB